jgi:hypothetical protein
MAELAPSTVLPPTKLSYNLKEAVDATGLGETSLRELMNEGALPSFKLKGRRLIKRERLQALIDRAETEGV